MAKRKRREVTPKYSSEVLNYSFKEANRLFGISKTHYYNMKRNPWLRSDFKDQWEGKTFGEWVVEKDLGRNEEGKRIVSVKCSCGNRKVKILSVLRAGRSLGCKQCAGDRKYADKSHGSWSGGRFVSGHDYYKIYSSSITRKLSFDLTLEYLDNLWGNQGGKCALSGISLEPTRWKGKERIANASLDRIDSSIGYVEGNVQWVHKDINKMKNSLPQDNFIELCKKVTKNAFD